MTLTPRRYTLIGLGLMNGGLWGVGNAIVDLRLRKLLKLLVSTPMRPFDFLFGLVIARSLLALGEAPLLLGFSALVFDVSVRGSPAVIAVVTLSGALAFAAMGLLVAARAQTTPAVTGLINAVSLPMILVSGTFFSSERFPAAAQPLVRALPLTALNDALRAVMLEGEGLRAAARPLAILGLWGSASLVLALKLFRWR